MNENALRYASIAALIAGFGWWIYRRFVGREISLESGASIDTFTLAGSDEIFIGERPLKLPSVAHIETDPTPGPLDFVAVTARRIASVISSWTSPQGENYRALFDAAEAKYGIPHGLLFRLAYQESRFRDDIINGTTRSSAGAVGMMQIVPRFHPSIDPGDAAADEGAALDPVRAIDYAGKYLASLARQFGSWPLALAAYNAGPGNVKKYGGIPPFQETQNYVAQITADVPVGLA